MREIGQMKESQIQVHVSIKREEHSSSPVDPHHATIVRDAMNSMIM